MATAETLDVNYNEASDSETEQQQQPKIKAKKQNKQIKQQPTTTAGSDSDSELRSAVPAAIDAQHIDNGSDSEDEHPEVKGEDQSPSKKRKQPADTTSASTTASTSAPTATTEEEELRREKKRAKIAELKLKAKAHHKHLYAIRDADVQLMSPAEQYTYWYKRYTDMLKDSKQPLTQLEMEEQVDPQEHMLQIADYNKATAHSILMLPTHIKAALPDYPQLIGRDAPNDGVNKRSPRIVIICSSALRCVEFVKLFDTTKELYLKSKTLKLFSKHLKLVEQAEELNRDVHIVVGTPARVMKLCDEGYMRLDLCRLIICDVQKDTKKFNLLTQPQIALEFARLYQRYIQKQVRTGSKKGVQAKLLFF